MGVGNMTHLVPEVVLGSPCVSAKRMHEKYNRTLSADPLPGSVFGAWNTEVMETSSLLLKHSQILQETEKPQPL